MNPTILTHSGHYFNFLEPEKSEILIEDIAHALSHLCRYTGHVCAFYSVAQHSAHVSALVPFPMRLSALMHDAAEAYIGDMSSPLKNLMPQYRVVEERVEKEIFKRFEIPWPIPPEVKQADLIMLASERRDLMPAGGDEHWAILDGVPERKKCIWPLGPAEAEELFMECFKIYQAWHFR